MESFFVRTSDWVQWVQWNIIKFNDMHMKYLKYIRNLLCMKKFVVETHLKG